MDNFSKNGRSLTRHPREEVAPRHLGGRPDLMSTLASLPSPGADPKRTQTQPTAFRNPPRYLGSVSSFLRSEHHMILPPAAAASPDTIDPDVLDTLAHEITTLSAHLHAETHRLLRLIAEFDRLLGWKREGFASCADWLAHRTGLDRMTAREKVRVARALAGLPGTSAAMANGDLSFSQVRALTRVADPDSEEDL